MKENVECREEFLVMQSNYAFQCVFMIKEGMGPI